LHLPSRWPASSSRLPAGRSRGSRLVEFDGQPYASAFDHEVDAEPAYPVLDLDAVSADDEVALDVAFEVGVKAAVCLGVASSTCAGFWQ
jgi:hypothetical protein